MDAGEKRKRLDEMRKVNRSKQWRARIPFTNAQVIAALRDEQAAWDARRDHYMHHRYARTIAWMERTGFLSKKILLIVLPRLVTTCTLCGKPALYRMGFEGRCAAHKGDVTAGMAYSRKLHELRIEIGAQNRHQTGIRKLAQARHLTWHRGRKAKA